MLSPRLPKPWSGPVTKPVHPLGLHNTANKKVAEILNSESILYTDHFSLIHFYNLGIKNSFKKICFFFNEKL